MDRRVTRMYLLIFGGFFSVISLVHIWTWVRMPDDVWWTPKAMAQTLGDARERVEVYARGESIENELSAGRLVLDGERLAPEDLRVRLNHRDRVKLQRVPMALLDALVAGMGLTLLALGVMGWLPSRTASSIT